MRDEVVQPDVDERLGILDAELAEHVPELPVPVDRGQDVDGLHELDERRVGGVQPEGRVAVIRRIIRDNRQLIGKLRFLVSTITRYHAERREGKST